MALMGGTSFRHFQSAFSLFWSVASPGCSYWGGRGERRRPETYRGVRGHASPKKFLFVGSLKRYFPHFQASFMII